MQLRTLSDFVLYKHLISLRNEDRDLIRNLLQDYVKRGGTVFGTQYLVLDLVVSHHEVCQIDWIPDILSKSSEPWLVDDLSSLEIFLLGTCAHVDAVFREELKKTLASYRLSAFSKRAPCTDRLFENTFGRDSIEGHFSTLRDYEKDRLLSRLCRTGSVSMMKLFIDMGIDVNARTWIHNLLGHAAAGGNMSVVCMLLKAGAHSSSALKYFLYGSDHLSDAVFKRLLEMLVENAKLASFSGLQDPLLAIIESSRALHLHPKAPEILLSRQIFTEGGFGTGTKKAPENYSYMYHAIRGRNSSLVDLLLQNGAHANAQISHLFKHSRFEMCTWITFSVIWGAASCTDVLIQHGAEVTALDGAGRSAAQLATKNALASHPRNKGFWSPRSVSDEEDAETLAVVERAFNLKFQGTKSLEDYVRFNEETAAQPPPRENRLVSATRGNLAKILGIVLIPTQTRLLHDRLRGLYHITRETWSLSFYEALLMRFLYFSSYALLLAFEVNAFIKGHKRIPVPSRSLLSAFALVMLALVWGSSQMGISWGPITA